MMYASDDDQDQLLLTQARIQTGLEKALTSTKIMNDSKSA